MTRRVHWLLPLVLAVVIARLWLMPLPSSFWLDETATVFVAQHRIQSPVAQRGRSPSVAFLVLHDHPRLGRPVGFSEIATRLPSVLAMLGLLALIGRLSMRLIHRDSAWFAAFACLSLAGFNYQAANARPLCTRHARVQRGSTFPDPMA